MFSTVRTNIFGTGEVAMVKVYFATNRNLNDAKNPTDFGEDFSANGLANLRFGEAEVSGEDLDQLGST